MIKRKTKTAASAVKVTPKATVTMRAAAAKKKKVSKDFEWTLQKLGDFVSKRAYYIWQDMGKPQGDDIKIWRKAEQDILSQLIKK